MFESGLAGHVWTPCVLVVAEKTTRFDCLPHEQLPIPLTAQFASPPCWCEWHVVRHAPRERSPGGYFHRRCANPFHRWCYFQVHNIPKQMSTLLSAEWIRQNLCCPLSLSAASLYPKTLSSANTSTSPAGQTHSVCQIWN